MDVHFALKSARFFDFFAGKSTLWVKLLVTSVWKLTAAYLQKEITTARAFETQDLVAKQSEQPGWPSTSASSGV